MKTLFRIVAVLFVLLLVALVGGYFALTNAAFQKKLVESKLPAGSSIESIHVTTGKVTLSGLVLMLEDGTRVQVGALDTAFEPLAAAFDQTIKMGVLTVEGLRVDLPAVAEPTPGDVTTGAREPQKDARPSTGPVAEEAATNPIDVLAAMGDFEWLLDIEGIALEGVIHDGKGSKYVARVNSPAIRPGESSKVDASLQLLADQPLASGMKVFDSTAALSFKQKIGGGFESLHLESNTSGKDAGGSQLISVKQALDLEVDDAAGVATVSVTVDADLPQPQALVPELATLGALKVTGHVVASTDGETLTLSAADLQASAAGAEWVSLGLKHPMILGGDSSELSGDLLEVTISALQLEWLNPWLPDGLQIQSSAPVSLSLVVAGVAGGAFAVTVAEPITLGPLTVTDSGAPMVQNLVVIVAPKLELSADQTLTYSLNSLSVADKYGSFIQGSSSGVIQLHAARDAATPFAGVQSQAALEIGLQELFQLPVLANSASIVSGRMELDLNIDASAAEPLQLTANISKLRARSMPSITRDYVISLALLPTSNLGEWRIGAKFLAGSVSRPSTDLQLKAVVNSSREPITFDADVSSKRVTQEDMSILAAAFTPREQTVGIAPPSRPSDVRSGQKPQAPRGVTVVDTAPVPPAWAMLDGRASVSIDEFRLEAGQIIEAISLKAVVSEPKLSVDPISAKIGEGELKGSSSVLYASSQLKPYTLTSDIRFEAIDPAFFVKPHESAQVQGLFDGAFELSGVGETLDGAVEDSTAVLKITGKQGVLTAFELDNRAQAGLGLAGLLGQSFDRPGITAVSRTIPYFKEIPFDHFVFELTRGTDKQVLIPQLRLTGESVLLDASGSVGPSALSAVMDQPLNLTLLLGAKGPLTEHLEILDLLQTTVAEDGFYHWKDELPITGTLSDPDTGALMDILNDAGKAALSKPKKKESTPAVVENGDGTSSNLSPQSEAEAKEAKKKSKDERRREDVEQVLDVLNSLF